MKISADLELSASKQEVEQWADAAFDWLFDKIWTPAFKEAWFFEDFWKAGNALDCMVNYWSVRKPSQDRIKKLQTMLDQAFQTFTTDDPDRQRRHWRDDYGWWGNAFVTLYKNAKAIGIDDSTKQYCAIKAKLCWTVLELSAKDSESDTNPDHKYLGAGYAAWNNGSLSDYLNGPLKTEYTPNTVTNLGFWALSLGIFENIDSNAAYFTAARKTFDWFYSFQEQDYFLFNPYDLIVETVNSNAHPAWCKPNRPELKPDPRAWSADQGVFLYNLRKTLKYAYQYDPLNLPPCVIDAITHLYKAFMTYSVCISPDDHIFREYETDPAAGGNSSNFNHNYATGPGVFMRYAGLSIPLLNNDVDGDDSMKQILSRTINASAASAWANQNDFNPGQIFCWDVKAPMLSELYKRNYDGQERDTQSAFEFAFQTAALDLFVAWLRLYSES